MEALPVLGACVVIACYLLAALCGVALPGEVLFMSLAAVGLPSTIGAARPSALGHLSHKLTCLAACFCACGVAWHVWSRAGAIADGRIAALLYALGGLAALTALLLSMQAAGTLTFHTGNSAAKASSRARRT
jgi:hypothetical protein